jgi:hypothetical protein
MPALAFQFFDPARQLFDPPVTLREHGVHLLGPGDQPRYLASATIDDASLAVESRFDALDSSLTSLISRESEPKRSNRV